MNHEAMREGSIVRANGVLMTNELVERYVDTYNITVPERLEAFFGDDSWHRFQKMAVREIPGWFDSAIPTNFAPLSIWRLSRQHAEWIVRESSADRCQYAPVAELLGTGDFLATNLKSPVCPIFFANPETGTFEPLFRNFDDFLTSLVPAPMPRLVL